MKITKATVLIGLSGPDKVNLTTDLPNSFPIDKDEPMYLEFKILKGTAVKYIKDNFESVPIEIINTKTGEMSEV